MPPQVVSSASRTYLSDWLPYNLLEADLGLNCPSQGERFGDLPDFRSFFSRIVYEPGHIMKSKRTHLGNLPVISLPSTRGPCLEAKAFILLISGLATATGIPCRLSQMKIP